MNEFLTHAFETWQGNMALGSVVMFIVIVAFLLYKAIPPFGYYVAAVASYTYKWLLDEWMIFAFVLYAYLLTAFPIPTAIATLSALVCDAIYFSGMFINKLIHPE